MFFKIKDYDDSFCYSSGDEKSREFEKKKIQQDLKNADEKLGTLVEGKIYFLYKIYTLLYVF